VISSSIHQKTKKNQNKYDVYICTQNNQSIVIVVSAFYNLWGLAGSFDGNILGLVLSGVILIYALSVGFWLFETLILAPSTGKTSTPFGHDDVQVRISTVNNAGIVQTTVDRLPETLTDIRIISESPMEIEGATVHVVPKEFSCTATHKGRALEWARRNVPCDREFVLFLDEDTLVESLPPLPDVDVVQFTELPLYTGSRWTYLCEVFRIGYQFEQRAFARMHFPLYVWGGGIAVRKSVEDQVTWDRQTITEDTAFVWTAAATLSDFEMRVVDGRFRNQAPGTIRTMLRQRRRWMSGTRLDAGMLPSKYRLLVGMRAAIWAFSPIVVVFATVIGFIPGASIIPALDWLLIGLFVFLHLIMATGALLYEFGPVTFLLAIILTVPIVFINTLGALWGYVSPTKRFVVTAKVVSTVIEEVHPGLSEGDLTEHTDDGPFGDTDAPIAIRELLRR
jgi:hypothetical protein